MIPSLNVSVGLTEIGLVDGILTAAPVMSRRAAASCTHGVGESDGATGALPLVGFKIPSTTVTRTVRMLGVALGVVGLVAARFGVMGVLIAADAFNRVVAVDGVTA